MGFFNDLTPKQFQDCMQTNYYATLWTTWVCRLLVSVLCGTDSSFALKQEASKRMTQQKSKGKVVLVSSVIGFFGLPGYSAYGPAKMAMRGAAADCM